MKSIGEVKQKQFTLRPRFTVIHHPIREKYELSMSAYTLIDSIDQLSHRPDHPWCTTPKEALGEFVGVTRKTVYNSINAGIKSGLVEKNERGDLRTTQKWTEQVRLYNGKEDQDDRY